MHTAAESDFPEPRRMAVRWVLNWIVLIMWEGGVVPVIVRSCWGIEKTVLWIPDREERALAISEVHDSQCMGTEKVAV